MKKKIDPTRIVSPGLDQRTHDLVLLLNTYFCILHQIKVQVTGEIIKFYYYSAFPKLCPVIYIHVIAIPDDIIHNYTTKIYTYRNIYIM